MRKDKKQKKEEKSSRKNSSRQKLMILLLAIVIVAAVAVMIIIYGLPKNEGENVINLTIEKPANLTFEEIKIEIAGVGIEGVGMIPCRRFGDSLICDPSFAEPTPKNIVIDPSMTSPPAPVPTLVSREGPVILAIESPQKVLAGDEFTANITVNPAENKIVGIEFNVIFSKLIAKSIELSEESDSAFSGTGNIDNEAGMVSGIVGMQPIGKIFPSETFLLASIKFKAIEKGEAKIELKQVKILDEKDNFVYFVTNPQTIQIG